MAIGDRRKYAVKPLSLAEELTSHLVQIRHCLKIAKRYFPHPLEYNNFVVNEFIVKIDNITSESIDICDFLIVEIEYDRDSSLSQKYFLLKEKLFTALSIFNLLIDIINKDETAGKITESEFHSLSSALHMLLDTYIGFEKSFPFIIKSLTESYDGLRPSEAAVKAFNENINIATKNLMAIMSFPGKVNRLPKNKIKNKERELKSPERENRHPGTLIGPYLVDLGWSVAQAAVHLGVTREHLYQVLRGGSEISTAMAKALSRNSIGGEPLDWLMLQAKYNLAQPDRPKAPLRRRTSAPKS